jgi:protein tyrosine/serine phosphatase
LRGGKDRTGSLRRIAADALGVPRDRVIEDYLVSNEMLDPNGSAGRATCRRGVQPDRARRS